MSEYKSAGTNIDCENILDDIESLKDKELIITEHAILRYIERAMGLDIEKVKSEILTDEIKAGFKLLGNGKYPTHNNCHVIIKNNSIVSVV